MCMRVHATHLVILEIAEGPLHGVPFLNLGTSPAPFLNYPAAGCPHALQGGSNRGCTLGHFQTPENDPSYLLDLSHLGGPVGGIRAALARMIYNACID